MVEDELQHDECIVKKERSFCEVLRGAHQFPWQLECPVCGRWHQLVFDSEAVNKFK